MEQVRSRGSALQLALALTCVVLAVELVGGLVSHSLALLSDAGHVLTDVFALGLAWFAVAQASRPADARRTYGYHRVSILAALVNSVTLIVIVIAIAYEAVRLLAHPEPVHGRVVILAAVSAEISDTEVVTSMDDLHGWALSSDEVALSCHVVVGDCELGEAEHVVRALEGRLCGKFAIGHTTIQVESCHPCGEIHHGAGDHNHPHEHRLFVSAGSAPAAAEAAPGGAAPPHAAGSSAPPR